MNPETSTWPFCPVCTATPTELCKGPGVARDGLHPERRALILGPHRNRPLRRGRTARAVGTVIAYVLLLSVTAVVVAGAVALIRWILS